MTQTLLGIDWGSRRVGLALGNTLVRQASPLPDVATEEAFGRIAELLDKEKASQVVMGLPRNLNGEETRMSETVRAVAKKLSLELECEVVFQDETLSTVESERYSKKYKDADPDSLAATVILQDYLNQI